MVVNYASSLNMRQWEVYGQQVTWKTTSLEGNPDHAVVTYLLHHRAAMLSRKKQDSCLGPRRSESPPACLSPQF